MTPPILPASRARPHSRRAARALLRRLASARLVRSLPRLPLQPEGSATPSPASRAGAMSALHKRSAGVTRTGCAPLQSSQHRLLCAARLPRPLGRPGPSADLWARRTGAPQSAEEVASARLPGRERPPLWHLQPPHTKRELSTQGIERPHTGSPPAAASAARQ